MLNTPGLEQAHWQASKTSVGYRIKIIGYKQERNICKIIGAKKSLK